MSVLDTRCPRCDAPMSFAVVEDRLPDGGILLRTRACSSCGNKLHIMRLTKKGVQLRKLIERARQQTPVDQEKMASLLEQYQAEMTDERNYR